MTNKNDKSTVSDILYIVCSKQFLDRTFRIMLILCLAITAALSSVAGYRLIIQGETLTLGDSIGFHKSSPAVFQVQRAAPYRRVVAQSGSVGMTHGQWGVPKNWILQRDLKHGGNNRQRGIVKGRVIFDTPFSTRPEVTAGITNIDADPNFATRIRVDITSVNAWGFTYDFVTWSNSTIHGAQFRWMAVGEAGNL